MEYRLVCTNCGKEAKNTSFRCAKCNGILEVVYKYGKLNKSKIFKRNESGISRYINLLPIKKMVTLGEGGTPLSKTYFNKLKDAEVLLKLEIKNPTKTFKDRGSAVELSKAAELGVKDICCASTGNMGLSVAYYARHLKLKTTIFISKGANKEKINKIRAQDAVISYVNGDFNKALNSAERFARKTGTFVCGDYHFRKEGQKTVAYEIAEQMKGRMPDYIFMPVGNGTLFSGVYKGFEELHKYRLIDKIPKVVAVQSEMCNPLVKAYSSNKKIRYTTPKTDADAIAVGYPTFGFESLRAIKRTGGTAVEVSENSIKDAVRLLEKYKIYAELGGGTGLAGLLKIHDLDSKIFNGKRIVVVITGNNEGKFV
jgi:threonine synthase